MENMYEWQPKTLRELRGRLGLTQADMARKLGCSLELIGDWELGRRCPERSHAQQLIELSLFAQRYADRMRHLPLADEMMGEQSLSQINHGHIEQQVEQKSDLRGAPKGNAQNTID